jgi:hypothetical protein
LFGSLLYCFRRRKSHICHCCVCALRITNTKGTLCTENTSYLRCHFINYRSRRQKVIRERSTFTATDRQTVFITHVSLLWFLWYTAPRWYWHNSWGSRFTCHVISCHTQGARNKRLYATVANSSPGWTLQPWRHAWSAVSLPSWNVRSIKPHFRVRTHN